MGRRMCVLLCAALLLCVSCFQIDEEINVDKDMKGTANFKMVMDLEPMILIMATMGRQMEGKEGPPTKEELDGIRADLLKKTGEDPPESPSLEEMKEGMPEGVTPLAAEVKQEGLKIVSSFSFGFDDLSKLASVDLSPAEQTDQPEDPMSGSLLDSPFKGLEVSEKGDVITIRTRPQDPTTKVKEQAEANGPSDPETEKMMREAFKDLRFTFRINAPFKAISHNATRTEGNTLIWEYDLARMEKLSDDPEGAKPMEVKFKR